MSLTLGDISVKMLLRGMSEIFLPMFSSRTFMVSRLIFKSFIHSEFIFVYGISWWSSFIFLHVAVHISKHHLLKRFPALVCWFINDGHSDRGQVVSHCGFNLHLSDDYWHWASFHMSMRHLYVLLGKVSIQIFSPFFKLDCLSSWCWVL